MSVLIVHRNPFEPFPYARWLAGYDGPVVAIAHRQRIESVGEEVPTDNLGLTYLEIMDRFDDELVIKRSLELATEYATTRIIAHHEADVQSAAWLREHLGLPGAWTADVLPFRDKALMKKLVSAAGVEVAAHVLPTTAEQARAFVTEHGFPVVFKDRAGYNAIGLRILRDHAALADHLAHVYADGPREDVLLEKFVPGRMCHVDGLVSGGRTVLIWPSQYQYDLASFGTDPGARIDLTLDPDDPLTDRLLRMTDQILAALKPAGSRLTDHGFHAEIFHTPDDRLVLCEIACRPAGAKLREVFQTMFGVNLGDYTTRAQAGLPMPALADTLAGGPPPRPRQMSGQLLMMKRPGLVRSVPTTPEDPWIKHFWVYARPGQVIPPAAGSSDFLTCVVGSAPTRAECHARLRELGDRFVAQVEIVEEP